MLTKLNDPCRLLVVDDEDNLRAVLIGLLEREGFLVDGAADGQQAVSRLERGSYAAVLSDLRMPGLDGLELLRWVKEHRPELPVVLLTAHGSVETAVKAMRAGAFDFVSKPFDSDELGTILEKAVASSQWKSREVHTTHAALDALVGASVPMQGLREQLCKVAPVPTNVLLLGETGTGKELAARALHEMGKRPEGPFIATNCAAIPESLVEAELFGHEKGAFSGAIQSRPGRFELADGGTLFLDEIGDMSPAVQPKILRALEQREVQRVGASHPSSVDVRFVAATHPDLEEKVRRGEFREDLFFRVGVLRVILPPLRERPEDIPELVEHFRIKHQARLGITVQAASEELLGRLSGYKFPGNVRELENFVESLIVLSEGGQMRAQDLPPLGGGGPAESGPPADGGNLKEVVRGAVERLERSMILRALSEQGGNVTRSAEALGLSRKGLQLKMKDYAIRRRPEHE